MGLYRLGSRAMRCVDGAENKEVNREYQMSFSEPLSTAKLILSRRSLYHLNSYVIGSLFF